METKNEHAIANGRGWLASIRDMVADLEPVECAECDRWHAEGAGCKARSIHGDDRSRGNTEDGAQEAARERIEESPLSIEVRSDWYSPYDADADKAPAEYCVLLSTGGPALRIVGDLSEHGEPTNARLEYQDWGIPWTSQPDMSDEDRDELLPFVACFYFGE